MNKLEILGNPHSKKKPIEMVSSFKCVYWNDRGFRIGILHEI